MRVMVTLCTTTTRCETPPRLPVDLATRLASRAPAGYSRRVRYEADVDRARDDRIRLCIRLTAACSPYETRTFARS